MRYVKIPACVCVAFALLWSAAFAQRPFDIKWANERLSVHASDAPLGDVIGELTRLTGIEVIGREKLTGRISVDFADLVPKEALSKVLVNVNYVVQERQAAKGNSAAQLVVSVHSMAGYALPADVFSGPLEVPGLDALVAKDLAEARDDKDQEANDDPDAYLDDLSKEKIAAAKLASEGAFGPKADVTSLIKHSENLYNDEIRLEALKALGTRPMPAVLPTLLKALGDEAWDVRAVGVAILGAATDQQSLHAVGQLLEKSEDLETRIDALRVLARRGDPESAIHLRTALNDPDTLIRDTASLMLAELDRREKAKAANRR